MKKSLVFGAAFAAIAFAGCSKEENNPPTNGRVALSVTSGIQTRAYDKMWEDDDAIGIYMLSGGTTTIAEGATNRRYTTPTGGENSTFAPVTIDQTIYFPVSETDRFDLVAYYPHIATIGENNLYPIDVTTQTSQKAIDLMGAAKVTNKYKKDANVAFAFEHKLVKLEIALQGDGTSITNAQLAGTVVKITNQQLQGTYDVVNGGNVVITVGNASEITLLTTGLKAEGIVLPNSDTKDMELTFAVPAPIDQTFRWAIKKAALSQKFDAGKKYKYTLIIGKEELNVRSTVTDWIPGNGDNGESGDAE